MKHFAQMLGAKWIGVAMDRAQHRAKKIGVGDHMGMQGELVSHTTPNPFGTGRRQNSIAKSTPGFTHDVGECPIANGEIPEGMSGTTAGATRAMHCQPHHKLQRLRAVKGNRFALLIDNAATPAPTPSTALSVRTVGDDDEQCLVPRSIGVPKQRIRRM